MHTDHSWVATVWLLRLSTCTTRNTICAGIDKVCRLLVLASSFYCCLHLFGEDKCEISHYFLVAFVAFIIADSKPLVIICNTASLPISHSIKLYYSWGMPWSLVLTYTIHHTIERDRCKLATAVFEFFEYYQEYLYLVSTQCIMKRSYQKIPGSNPGRVSYDLLAQR
jgi:hypothetical protein